MTTVKQSFESAYWADENVPDLSQLLNPHNIDALDFAKWLAPLLGRYRGYMQVRDSLEPPASVASESLAKLAKALREAAAELAPNRRPAVVDAHLATAALRAEVDLHSLVSRLRVDSNQLEILATRVRKELDAQPAKRGRKNMRARDRLLSEVVEKLRSAGCKKIVAELLTAEILDLCWVEVGEQEAVSKAAKKGKK